MPTTLDDVVRNIEKLPTLNTVAFQVIQLCSDNEIPIPRLVKVISGDQSLASQILKVANSSYFNYPRTIYSLDRAIVILGFNLLKDIAVSLSVFSLYKGLESSNFIDLKKMWRHSMITGFTLKVLSENYDSKNTELLYIAGLLHDIGKLVLTDNLGEDYFFLIEKSQQEGKSLTGLESRFLGFDHCEVGARLLEIWNLPQDVVQMVKYHHLPGEYESQDDLQTWIKLLYLGNLLSHLMEQEVRDPGLLKEMDPDFDKYFSFSESEIQQLIENIENEISAQQSYIELFEIGSI